ncbi:MAG: hypothetical protein GY757_54570 [bacterium]|nr:hypothetical protein [bacterium]
MKIKKIGKKLTLNKNTVSNLESEILLTANAKGGARCVYPTLAQDITCDPNWGGYCSPSRYTCGNYSCYCLSEQGTV